MKVLYLDYDGVLHPEAVHWHPALGLHLAEKLSAQGHALFEHAPLLAELLSAYPSVRVVLSTSWAHRFGYATVAIKLPPTLAERVVGATCDGVDDGAFLRLERGQQVLADVARRRPQVWLAIDDDAEGWRSSLPADVVVSDPIGGISEPRVFADLAMKLERFR